MFSLRGLCSLSCCAVVFCVVSVLLLLSNSCCNFSCIVGHYGANAIINIMEFRWGVLLPPGDYQKKKKKVGETSHDEIKELGVIFTFQVSPGAARNQTYSGLCSLSSSVQSSSEPSRRAGYQPPLLSANKSSQCKDQLEKKKYMGLVERPNHDGKQGTETKNRRQIHGKKNSSPKCHHLV